MKSNHTKSPNTSVKITKSIPIIFAFTAMLLFISMCFYSLALASTRNNRINYIKKYKTLTDNNITENLYNYLSESLSRPITSLDTLSLFFETNQNDSDYFHELRIDLHNHHLIKRVFQDIILYRTSDDAFVSAARAGYNIQDTYSNNSLSYADLHELLTLTRREKPFFYITENSRTYYIYPIYLSNDQSTSSASYYAGFCAIWLEENSFFRLDSIETQDNDTTLIINNDNILYANGRNVLSAETIFNIIDKFEESSDNFLYETLFSTNYAFFYTKSEKNDLIYLYYEPVSTPAEILFNFTSSATIMYWFCIITALILSAAILFLKLQNAGVIKLNSTPGRESSASHESLVFKNSFDLLHGNNIPGRLDDTLCSIINSPTPYKYTSCILIEPKPIAILKMSGEQKLAFIKDVSASISLHLENTPDTYYSVIHYPCNLITCIINSSSFIPENLAHNILDQLSIVYEGCPFNVFCTTPTISLSELPRNYAFILDSCKYSYIYSYNNVFTQDTIELYEAADSMIDTGLTKKILDLLSQDYFDELIQYIRNLPTVVRQRGFSYIRVKDHYRIIFNIINDYCKENQPDYQYRDMPLSNIINQFETIDECSDFLCDEITLLAEAIATAREEAESNANKKYIDHIIEYIDKNIESISLTSTAEHFNISVAHLSRIFKELTGTNFSDYVADMKLREAAKLLIENRDMSIGDIAKKLGYNTPAYFSRKFKEHFDTTPAAYRKLHLNDNQ